MITKIIEIGFIFISIWAYRANKRIKNLETVLKSYILKENLKS